MSEILGINAIAEDLLRDPEQVKMVKAKNQVLFTWTGDDNNKETLSKLRKMDIDGIIYDRMDVHNSKEVKESIFLVEKRQEEEELGRSSPTSTCSCSSGPRISSPVSSPNAVQDHPMGDSSTEENPLKLVPTPTIVSM